MRTAIGATAVNIAKPTNLSAPMIHAFLDNIRYITIELNGSSQCDSKKCRSQSASATGMSGSARI